MVDNVKERHGVSRPEGFVALLEWDHEILIRVVGGSKLNDALSITSADARYLASKLRRLALRMDERNEPDA